VIVLLIESQDAFRTDYSPLGCLSFRRKHMQDFLISIGLTDSNQLLILTKTGLRIVIIMAVAFVIKLIASRLITQLKNYLKNKAEENLEEYKRIDTLGRVFRYIATIIITLIAIIQILNELGISIAPVLAAAGVVGLAIGFGAQSLVKDYFTGFVLLLENQVRQGDVVEVGSKSGFVEEVTLRYIKMRDYSGNVHYVPNGTITTVTNMSREFAFAVIDVAVAYRENIEQVMEIMETVGSTLRKDDAFKIQILDDMEMAGVDQLADSAVMIRCRFKVIPLAQWRIKREYFKRLKAAFDQTGIEIPFPHLTIYPGVKQDGSAPALNIKLNDTDTVTAKT
jgi:moderate conductance mechanosensitive channel